MSKVGVLVETRDSEYVVTRDGSRKSVKKSALSLPLKYFPYRTHFSGQYHMDTMSYVACYMALCKLFLTSLKIFRA